MKQLPKKEEEGVAGGLTTIPRVPIVEQPGKPLPYPQDPCIPTINDPLGDATR